MPTLPRNHILQGLSGKLGNLVFRQLRGNPARQAAPVRKAPFRPGERANQQNFRGAIMYAKEGRLPGWIAQWKEMRTNKEPIGRPRQIYTGETVRDYVPMSERA